MVFRLNRERKTIKVAENLGEMQPILTSHQSLGAKGVNAMFGLSLGYALVGGDFQSRVRKEWSPRRKSWYHEKSEWMI